jgi:hypothetical protein
MPPIAAREKFKPESQLQHGKSATALDTVYGYLQAAEATPRAHGLTETRPLA